MSSGPPRVNTSVNTNMDGPSYNPNKKSRNSLNTLEKFEQRIHDILHDPDSSKSRRVYRALNIITYGHDAWVLRGDLKCGEFERSVELTNDDYTQLFNKAIDSRSRFNPKRFEMYLFLVNYYYNYQSAMENADICETVREDVRQVMSLMINHFPKEEQRCAIEKITKDSQLNVFTRSNPNQCP